VARASVFVSAVVALACGREPAGIVNPGVGFVVGQPIAWVAEWPTGTPAFQTSGDGATAFNRVRVLLHHPDGSVALDTLIAFPDGARDLTVTLPVRIPANTPPEGIPLDLNLRYVNARGDTVFRGGPARVTVVPTRPGAGPPPPATVTIPLRYTGQGANATSVVISPRALTANTGETFNVSAVALDANGAVIAGTPIAFSSDNETIARVDGTGAGTAGAQRGSTTIRARLLTGQSDAAVLTVLSPPQRLAAVSGGGQQGPAGSQLPQPVVVQATARDGGPAADVAITFAASGGGLVGTATARTDAQGRAQTTWRLGTTPGPQTLTASAAGLDGSPVTFAATARPIDPVALLIASQPPEATVAGNSFEIVVHALDAFGGVAAGFNGPVTLGVASGPSGGSLVGAATANAVAGVARFSAARLLVAGAYTISASAPGLRGATSAPVTVTHGPAMRLVFQNYPTAGAVAGTPLDLVTVDARDAFNNLATGFSGPVSLSVLSSAAIRAGNDDVRMLGSPFVAPAPSAFTAALNAGETVTATARNGVAQFNNLLVTLAGTLSFTASSSGLQSAVGPTFGVAAGPPARLSVVGGAGQTGAAGGALATAITVQVADSYGNAVAIAGRSVTFTASSGGSASPATTTTSASGQASTTWTLGATVGTQTLSASSSGILSGPIEATAFGGNASSGGHFMVIHDVNWLDPSYGINASYPSNSQFLRNLVNFTVPSGPRATANKILLFDFGTPVLTNYTFTGNWLAAKGVIESQGLVTAQTTTRSVLSSVPADVKMLILHGPTGTFSTTEVNALKTFIAQGGRVLYIGENSGFQYTLTAANLLIAQMGGSTTAVPGCAFGQTVAVAHPLTAGMTLSGALSLNVACASTMTAGAGDVVLIRDLSNNPLVVIVNVSTTLIPVSVPAPVEVMSSVRVDADAAADGIDRTAGPVVRRPR